MQRIAFRKGVLIGIGLGVIGLVPGTAQTRPAVGVQAVVKFKDLGDAADPDPTSPIFIPSNSGRWSEDTPEENPDLPTGWEPYSPGHRAEPGWISMRTVLGDYYGDFYVHTEGIPLTADGHNAGPLWLAVRYKDTVLSPERDAYYGTRTYPWEGKSAGVWAFTGSNNAQAGNVPWVRIGELGGRNDKVWRTSICAIPPGALRMADGLFRFSLGYPAPFGRSSLYGELRVDWIKLSTVQLTPEPERKGFFPAAHPSKFAALPRTGFLMNGKPFFPIILDVNDGESSAREDSFQLWKDTGFNVIGYYENADSQCSGAGRSYWGYKAPFVEGGLRFMGFGNFLDACQQHGLKGAIFLWNSMRRYWIVNVKEDRWANDPLGGDHWRKPDGTFMGMADQICKVVSAYKNHPAYFGIDIKDEIDHEAPEWGAPMEGIRYFYARLQRLDPDHPQWVNLMGYRRLMWLHNAVAADGIESFDRYPNGKADEPYGQVAEWMEEIQRQKGECAILPIHSIMDFPPVEQVRIVTWISLIHGAQGLNYFVYQGGRLDHPAWWQDMRAMLAQVIATVPALHRTTSTLLGYSRATTPGPRDYYHLEHKNSGDLTTDNPQIDAVLRRVKATGERYLFAINLRTEAAQTTFHVKDLAPGTPVQVLFENRTLKATGTGIHDAFAGYQQHIYVWKSLVANKR